ADGDGSTTTLVRAAPALGSLGTGRLTQRGESRARFSSTGLEHSGNRTPGAPTSAPPPGQPTLRRIRGATTWMSIRQRASNRERSLRRRGRQRRARRPSAPRPAPRLPPAEQPLGPVPRKAPAAMATRNAWPLESLQYAVVPARGVQDL